MSSRPGNSSPNRQDAKGAKAVTKRVFVNSVALNLQNALFLNFDVEVDTARFLAAATLSPPDPLRALGNSPVLVVDEAQRLPDAARIIKGWYDARLPEKYLLLGSSSLDLLDQAAESLTGRNRKLLLPLLFFVETLNTQVWADADAAPGHLCRHFAPQLRVFLVQRLGFGSDPDAAAIHNRFLDSAKKSQIEAVIKAEPHRAWTSHPAILKEYGQLDADKKAESSRCWRKVWGRRPTAGLVYGIQFFE